jgi:modulator of FtsH protease
MEGWENFFVAQVGASAALAGLVFVGVSINLTRIMSFPALPGRALEAVVALVTVLIESSVFLVPGQSVALLGGEVALIGLTGWGVLTLAQRDVMGKMEKQYRASALRQLALGQVTMLAFLVGGMLMLTRGAGGAYLMVPAIVCAYLTAIVAAWILLIEINR